MATLQDRTQGLYRAVVLIPATGFAAPKMDVTNGVVTAELQLMSLADQTGAAIGTNANPLVVSGGTGGGSANFTPTQFTASTSTGSTVALAARAGRASVTIENTSSTPVYLSGSSGVTTSTGFLLPGVVGASLTIAYAGALYAVTSTGTALITFAELY